MMTRRIGVCAIIFLIFSSISVSQPTGPVDLARYQWKNRLLLIFAPSADHPAYRQQLDELEGKENGLSDRDLKLFHLLLDGTASIDQQKIPRGEVDRLIRKFNVEPQSFTVILIGKDGADKLRQTKPLKAEELFSVIDAMPMYQPENGRSSVIVFDFCLSYETRDRLNN